MITKLPTLYSRRSDGAIQDWTIEIDGDKYRTISGIINCTHVVAAWTVATPKNVGRSNESTGAKQALKEAKAEWVKKVAKGYHEKLEDIDKISYTEPMLAKEYDPDTITFPVYSQPKLDGIRCIARKDGLWSRNGKPFVACPHILEALKPLFKKDPGLILDGEFYADKYADNFNAICEAVKRTKIKDGDLEKSKQIQYWMYDVPSHQEIFSDRIDLLNKIIPADHPHLKVVETKKIANKQQLDKYYEEYLEAGYEGQMVRLDAPYEFKRSKHLLKRKEFQNAEYRIKDIEEGVGNRAGTAGAFILEMGGGKTFRSNIKGGRSLVATYLKEKLQLIGKTATVKFFNLTPDGVPRFPYVVAIRDYE